MKVHSLGLQTDLAIHLREGLIEEHPDHLVLRTPDNPDFYGGNALVIPALDDLDAWERRFTEAFPTALHRAFSVDNREGLPSEGSLEEARARGYNVRRLAALSATADTLRLASTPRGHSVRRLDEDDWSSQLELMRQVDAESGLQGEAHDRYLTAYVASRQRWSQAGTGSFWGVFDGSALVASAGLFFSDGLGRYQDVVTAPHARRRGAASALVSKLGHEAFERGCHAVVIVTVDDSDAHRLYRGLGFVLQENYVDMSRSPAMGSADGPPGGPTSEPPAPGPQEVADLL